MWVFFIYREAYGYVDMSPSISVTTRGDFLLLRVVPYIRSLDGFFVKVQPI